MELRSFIAGMLFLIGAQLLIPLLGVKVDVTLPYQPLSSLVVGIVLFILAYYIFKSN